jgi:hypothetical protein
MIGWRLCCCDHLLNVLPFFGRANRCIIQLADNQQHGRKAHYFPHFHDVSPLVELRGLFAKQGRTPEVALRQASTLEYGDTKTDFLCLNSRVSGEMESQQ